MGESRASTRAARMRPQRCELIPGRFLITPARTNGSLPLEYRRCLHQSTGRAHPNRSAVARLTWHRLVPHRAFPQQYMPHQLAPRPSRNPCGVPTTCQCELSGTLTKSCSESLSDSGGACALSVRDGVAWKPARPTPRAATVLAIDWATE